MTNTERQSVLSQVLAHAARNPDKPAIIASAGSISYGEIAAGVDANAAILADRFEVRQGDRVALLAHGQPDFACAYLAVHKLGGICLPLDPEIPTRRLEEILGRATPRLIVSESGDRSVNVDEIGFDNLAAAAASATRVCTDEIPLSSTADILFTTGTTGRSKGVMLSHYALAAACAHINQFIGTQPSAVEVLPLPLSHSFGLGRLRCVLSVGGTLVLVPGFMNAAAIIRALEEYEGTGFASVPAGLAILMSDKRFRLGRFSGQLDYIEIGSASMPMAHKQALMQELPTTRICMHYGLTEASRSAYLSFHDDRDHLDSIGRPSPGVEMRIVDEAGTGVDPGEDGRIQVRGAHLTSGYWDDPALTEKSLKDGWLDTGDLGWRDDDGYFHLRARSSDIINIGGRKVAPQEIEEVLSTHPALADCACVGMPDPQGLSGEIICAFLVARADLDERPKFTELARLLRQNLESYKIPHRFSWIDAIPKSASGKRLRRQLRELD